MNSTPILEQDAERAEPLNASAKVPSMEQVHEGEHSMDVAEPQRPSVLKLLFGLAVIALLFGGLAVLGFQFKARQASAREAALAAKPTRPRVLVAVAQPIAQDVEYVLPGTSMPRLDTAVFARTSGYLKRWLVDIGDSVQEGDLLAEIETPEIDAQLLQAQATLEQSKAEVERAKANSQLAKVTYDRAAYLVQRDATSRQEYDEADASLSAARANLKVMESTVVANEANVRRLSDLQHFQRITAPFSGVVTARNFDPGALVVADDAASKELFHLSQIDSLRVFVEVPQTFASQIVTGMSTPVFRREDPERVFMGAVTRTTKSVDPRSRTLRVEILIENKELALLPGMYLQARFRFDGPESAVGAPGAAVITRSEGIKVAVLDEHQAIRYRDVKIGRDFGTTVEVLSGLRAGDQLVIRPGDDLPDGTIVDVVTETRS